MGYTAAFKEQSGGNHDPVIQVWRKDLSQSGSYHKIGDSITIDKASVCVGGLLEVSTRVFSCNVRSQARISVQSGDILGLELPPKSREDVRLAFARISSGPANYIFRSPLSSPLSLREHSSIIWDLPQITLEIESSQLI